MQMIPLVSTARSLDTVAKDVRLENKVPCVVYGNEVPNTSLQCEYNAMAKAYLAAGESTLVELDMDGKKVPVLFHQVDLDPVTNRIAHVDFYAVNMKKEIEANIPVELTGESLAVKELGGILVHVMDHVSVRCLPANLPHELYADISSLAQFGDTLTVAAIQVPEGVVIEEDLEAVIATVQEPREEEPEPVAVVAEGAEGAAPTAEGAEGAAPAAEGAPKKE